MPTQKSTGMKKSQTTGQQTEKQVQKPLSIRADVYWMNPDEDSNIRANASLTIAGAFKTNGIKVVSGSKGNFVSMPSYKTADGYKDIFHALSAEARQQMNDAVMKAYEQKLAEQNQSEEPTEDDNLTDGEEEETPANKPDEEEGQVMSNM